MLNISITDTLRTKNVLFGPPSGEFTVNVCRWSQRTHITVLYSIERALTPFFESDSDFLTPFLGNPPTVLKNVRREQLKKVRLG